jgi:hypothetical protein
MGTLIVGRVNITASDGITIRWTSDASGGSHRDRLRGELASSSLAATQALRTELLEQIDRQIAFSFSDDTTRDGFYILRDADIELDDYSLNSNGLFDFSLVLERIGSVSQVEIQSLLTTALKVNSHGLLIGEVQPWHAPAVGAVAYDVGNTAPTAHTRTTEDGVVPVMLGIATTVDPKWSVTPVDFYKAAVRIKVGNPLVTRGGLDYPDFAESPANWELSNGLVKVTPGATTGVSNGRIIVGHWDGSSYETKTYNLKFATTTVVPKWHYFTILHNTPELGIIRLVRDADEAPATAHRHILDLTLRRGSLFVSCYYTFTGGATTWSVDRDAVEAATSVTPTGAASAVAIRATSNDAAGNRFVLGTSMAHTEDLTNGGIDFASTRTFDFFLGAEIGGSGAGANDNAAAQSLQYMGVSAEQVRLVRR